MVNRCSDCSQDNKINARFCRYCGGKLVSYQKDTEEDTEEFVEKGSVRKIEIPTEVQEIAKKLEKGEKLTAEDLIEPPK